MKIGVYNILISIAIYLILSIIFLIASVKNLKCNDSVDFLWGELFSLITILFLLIKYLNNGNLYECIFISTEVESIFALMNLKGYKGYYSYNFFYFNIHLIRQRNLS